MARVLIGDGFEIDLKLAKADERRERLRRRPLFPVGAFPVVDGAADAFVVGFLHRLGHFEQAVLPALFEVGLFLLVAIFDLLHLGFVLDAQAFELLGELDLEVFLVTGLPGFGFRDQTLALFFVGLEACGGLRLVGREGGLFLFLNGGQAGAVFILQRGGFGGALLLGRFGAGFELL